MKKKPLARRGVWFLFLYFFCLGRPCSGAVTCAPYFIELFLHNQQHASQTTKISAGDWMQSWLQVWEKDLRQRAAHSELNAFDLYQSLGHALELNPNALTSPQADWIAGNLLPRIVKLMAPDGAPETPEVKKLREVVAAMTASRPDSTFGELSKDLPASFYLGVRALPELPTSYPKLFERLAELANRPGSHPTANELVEELVKGRPEPLARLTPTQRAIVTAMLADAVFEAQKTIPITASSITENYRKVLTERLYRIRALAKEGARIAAQRKAGRPVVPHGLPSPLPPGFHEWIEHIAFNQALYATCCVPRVERLNETKLAGVLDEHLRQAYLDASEQLHSWEAIRSVRSHTNREFMKDFDVRILSAEDVRKHGFFSLGTLKQLEDLSDTPLDEQAEKKIGIRAEKETALAISRDGWAMVAMGDKAVGAFLAIPTKTFRADFIAMNPETGRFLIAETKSGRDLSSGRISHAIEQLAATTTALKTMRADRNLGIDYEISTTKNGIPQLSPGQVRIEVSKDGFPPRVEQKEGSGYAVKTYGENLPYVSVRGTIQGKEGLFLFERRPDGTFRAVFVDGQPVKVREMRLDYLPAAPPPSK